MIIGITGTDGAGKGTVVDYLVREHGFTHYSSRAIIAAEVERQGLPMSRNQLRLTANALRAQFGNAVVVQKSLEAAKREGRERIIIESVRATAEADYLKEHGGVLVAVDADPHIRFERVQARRSETDRVSFEEFIAHEALEKDDPDPNGMQKARVMEMADHTFVNNGTVAELEAAVVAWLGDQQDHLRYVGAPW